MTAYLIVIVVALQLAADLFLVWLLLGRTRRVASDDELDVARAVGVVIEP